MKPIFIVAMATPKTEKAKAVNDSAQSDDIAVAATPTMKERTINFSVPGKATANATPKTKKAKFRFVARLIGPQ